MELNLLGTSKAENIQEKYHEYAMMNLHLATHDTSSAFSNTQKRTPGGPPLMFWIAEKTPSVSIKMHVLLRKKTSQKNNEIYHSGLTDLYMVFINHVRKERARCSRMFAKADLQHFERWGNPFWTFGAHFTSSNNTRVTPILPEAMSQRNATRPPHLMTCLLSWPPFSKLTFLGAHNQVSKTQETIIGKSPELADDVFDRRCYLTLLSLRYLG